MRQTTAWLVAVSMLVALLAGGLFSTLAWTYQANNKEAVPTAEAGFTPVAAIARPTGANAAAATPVAARATVASPGTPAPTIAGTTVASPGTSAPTAASTTVTSPAATAAPVTYVANVANGQQVYARLCNACHPNGAAGAGPTLRGAPFKAKFADDASLQAVIRNGQGTMPAFRQLTDAELNDLVAYLRTLD